uniref:LOB domain-containing protein n=1 Tax=Leersia perrieri TaxID=77586 RepID=A0A0D9VWD8_9ORYZ
MSSSSSPCAACKLLRRKCTQGCVFAPYFPPDQPAKFANVHKVFGASNVTKLLNDLSPEQREDAVNSLAYEAEARLRDPVYGCVAYISVLQLRIKQVRDQLVDARKELSNYIGPNAAFLPAAAPHPYLAGVAAADPHHHYHQAGLVAAGYAPQMQHQMAGLHVQQQQQIAAIGVARDHQEMMRARHAAAAAAYAQVQAATVAVEAETFDGGPAFLLHQQQPPSSEPAMALPYRMEPSPPQPSSGHSHDEVSQQHHRHHPHADGSDEGSGGGAPPG